MSVIKPQEINLDFSQNTYKDIIIKQNDIDSRSVIITCTNNGVFVPIDAVSQLCYIQMLTPDERPIYNSTTILSDGRIQVDFDEQMTLVGGNTVATLQIIDSVSEEIIHTMNINVIIISNAISNDAIIATPEFNALTEALLTVGEFSELINSVDAIEANEEIRIANEEERKEVFEDMVADLQAEIDAIPNGVVRVDFVDETEVDIVPIERVNGISLYVENEDVMASWDNNGETKEVNLCSGSSSGSSGFNNIYAETSINLGRKVDTDIGEHSVTAGSELTVSGDYSVAFGKNSSVGGTNCGAFGDSNEVNVDLQYTYTADGSFALGKQNVVKGGYNFASGHSNNVTGLYASAFGYNNTVTNSSDSYTSQSWGFASGYSNTVLGYYGNCLGNTNVVNSQAATCLGSYNEATGDYSFCAGANNKTTGAMASVALGYYNTAYTDSVAIGRNNNSTGYASYSFGYGNEVNGDYSVAIGQSNNTTSMGSIAIGYANTASKSYSVVIGYDSKSESYNAISIGCNTIASSPYQLALGKYNVEDTEEKYACIFGGGEGNSERKNIFTLDWDGNAVFNGDVANSEGKSLSSSIQLPTDEEGNINYGTAGQILVSNGDGTFAWMSIAIAEGGAY